MICEIQVKNGLDLGENYRNINGYKTFAASIATLVDKQVKFHSLSVLLCNVCVCYVYILKMSKKIKVKKKSKISNFIIQIGTWQITDWTWVKKV